MKAKLEIEVYPCKQPDKRIKLLPVETSYGLKDFLVYGKDNVPIGIDTTIDMQTRLEITRTAAGVIYICLGRSWGGHKAQWYSTKMPAEQENNTQ